MHYTDSLEAVVQRCRFVVGTGSLHELLPDLARSLPPLGYVEFMDTTRHRALLGYPVVRGKGLVADLHRLVVSELGRCLADPDHVEDVEALGADQLRGDPYVRTLTDLLVRASAQGDRLHLDGVLWLVVVRTVASLLSHDAPLVERLREHAPREAAKGEKYLVELLKLKGADPARHALVKNRVLRALLARNDFAISSVSEVIGDVYSSQLYRELVASRLPFTEAPDGLYTFFDLREAFAIRDFGLPYADFAELHGVLCSVAEDAYRAVGAGQGTPAQRYLVDRWATDPLLEKAGRLQVAEVGAATEAEDFAARVGWLVCLQPGSAEYLLAHLDQLADVKSVAKRHSLDKDAVRRLKNPGELRGHVAPFVEVQQSILKWDVFNALGAFLIDLKRDRSGRLQHEERALRANVVAVDLESAKELYSPRRHGTGVFLQIVGFPDKAARLLGEKADSDFVALCVQSLMQIRRTIGVLKGEPRYFADGLLVDSFPRALDALRYVALFRAAFERNRHVRQRPWEDARANPFAEELRVGLGTGDFFEVTIPAGGLTDAVPSLPTPVGQVLTAARALVAEPATGGAGVTEQEYDPLEVFRAGVVDGQLDNRGIVAFETTFREVAAAVRLEGLPHWSRAEPDGVIAGRRIQMKNYRFALIFDDPATGQVVLARRVEGASAGTEPAYEFLLMWPDAFATFLDRVHDMERHQPALRRSAPLGAGRGSVVAARPITRAHRPQPPPSDPVVPAVALNPPDQHDFLAADEGGGIEARLGMDEDLSSAGDLSAGLSGSFDWAGGEPSTSGLSALPEGEPGPEPHPASAAYEFGPATGYEYGGEPIAALPLEDSDPDHAATSSSSLGRITQEMMTSPSLLGVLEADVAGRIRKTERAERRDLQEAGSITSSASLPAASSPEKLRVPRPDFHLMFRDYVYFWIGTPGGEDSEIAVGRRYRDVFFDLHRFPSEGPEWGPDDAVRAFLRSKIRKNFVPQSLNYEALPDGAGERYPLSVERLEAAFDDVT